ncbi:MAG: ACT domain-containing protein [Alphaproteobacteria bacterium]|nr:ACT domain-containing protein [Alphaproteobacteria bacterium]
MKIVVTILGADRIGIVATVTAVLAENKVNILDINQNIVNGIFNMIVIADMEACPISLKDLQKLLKEKGETMGQDIRVQHEDIFKIMHRI